MHDSNWRIGGRVAVLLGVIAAGQLCWVAGSSAGPVVTVPKPGASNTVLPPKLPTVIPPSDQTPLSVAHVSVSRMATIDLHGGEIQSTVVAPGKNASCPAGRFLVSNDYELANGVEHQIRGKDYQSGASVSVLQATDIVTGHDLDPNGATYASSIFEAPWPRDAAKRAHRWHAGEDHDIVALPDGTVMLAGVGESDATEHAIYPNAAHDWWKWSYFSGDGQRVDHGPGARTVIYVWRSDDCGAHFKWISEIDPANISMMEPGGRQTNGFCAMPQVGRVPAFFTQPDGTFVVTKDAPDGKTRVPILDADGKVQPITRLTAQQFGATFRGFNQGGTDGPLVRVDPRDGAVYLVHGCAGSPYQNDLYEPYGLAPYPDASLNSTVVFRSANDGATWAQAGYFPVYVWRGSAVPLSTDRMAFWANGAALIAQVRPGGALAFEPKDGMTTTPALYKKMPRWPRIPTANGICVSGNVLSSYFISRGPKVDGRDTLLFSYPGNPSSVPGSAKRVQWGNGQDVVMYEPTTNQTITLDPVVPRSHNPRDYVIHLTAIDLGSGPVLFYWLDVSASSQTATVIGRLFFDGGFASSDFVISQTASASGAQSEYGQPVACLGKAPGVPPFYGDYHTAGGFSVGPGHDPRVSKTPTYNYYPMWLDPAGSTGGLAHYAEVKANYGTQAATDPAAKGSLNGLTYKNLSKSGWTQASPRATLGEITKLRAVGELEVKVRRRP